MTQYSRADALSERLVSIIIPVYNTDKDLIARSVESALCQSHPYLEVIVINDGSSHEIAEFLNCLVEEHARVRVIHKSNGGVSSARNTGVDHARGDFIIYLDADDYLEREFLTEALDIAFSLNAGVVFGGLRVLSGVGAVAWRTGGPSAQEAELGTQETIVTACLNTLASSPSTHEETPFLSVTNVVSALYRTDIARLHRFPEGVSHAEDRLYNVLVLLGTDRAAFCSDVWYVYDARHEQGATRQVTTRTVQALMRTVREFAGLRGVFAARKWLSSQDYDRMVEAAANGVLNYLKMLTGVMAVAGRFRINRQDLRHLLLEPSVESAVTRATPQGWQNRAFRTAARLRQIDLLMVFGWLWVRTSRGFHMSAAPSHRRNRKNG